MTYPTSESPEHPARIGPYKLLEPLGEGGMGEVWLAEQTEPVHRQVALKLMKLGMDTKEVLARFEAERQALAVMDHPGIAQVFDGGGTEDGRPYFVMELVRGTSLTAYCDEHRLSLEERIGLFIDVCHGVQHAHQKGVVHRDLKPSNILVTVIDGQPMVKIIDFGIAKALEPDSTDRTLVTMAGQIVGTPLYMSPEQAGVPGVDIDTRTDVYSLGVILYELLVGAPPFDLRARVDQAIRFLIQETEVPRPSARLTTLGEAQDTIAEHRQTTVEALRRELRSDLDWVVLKALEKDRNRRYDAVTGLASDLERHLRHEPVSARAPNTGYRVQKFVRRHRLGVAAGVVTTTGLVLGLTLATVGMVRAQRAEARAEEEAETAIRVSEFMEEVFSVTNPSETRGNTVTARELLDRGSERINWELTDRPHMQARLMNTMGVAYWRLGLYREAEPLLKEALAIQEESSGPWVSEVAETLENLGNLYWKTGEFQQSRAYHERALEIRRDAFGSEHPEIAQILQDLGAMLSEAGDYEEAEALHRRALAIWEEAFGPDHIEVAAALTGLGNVFEGRGEYDEALSIFQRAYEIVEEALPANHPRVATALVNLAILHARRAEFEAAISTFSEVLAIREEVYGPDHPEVGSALLNLGLVYAQMGEFETSQGVLERALTVQEGALDPEHPDVANTLKALADVLFDLGQTEEARPYYQRAISIQEATLGADHPDVATTLISLGGLYHRDGDLSLAISTMERALQIYEGAFGSQHPNVGVCLENLALIRMDAGEHREAAPLLERAIAVYEEALGTSHPYLADTLETYARLLRELGRTMEADEQEARATAIRAGGSSGG
jgi:non-specific serine/threonine protein kinase/serine/threonine-protein kinase